MLQKRYVMFILSLLLILGTLGFAGEMSLAQLLEKAENNPQWRLAGKQAAMESNLPLQVFIPGQVIIEVYGIDESGRPLYAVITNFAHPARDGSVAYLEDVRGQYDFSEARLTYGHGKVVNAEIGKPQLSPIESAGEYLMIPESTGDRVMLFDMATGDVVDLDFVPGGGFVSTPIQAVLGPNNSISVSDQLTDLVVEYDTSGAFIDTLAPAGGVNTSILDNMRGHTYHPTSNNLLVTVASGANSNAIAEFDLGGNYLGNFIANGSGGLNSPWSILFRDSDVLVTGGSSNTAHRYDYSGTYIADFTTTTIPFAEQASELANGDVAVSAFSTPSGVYLFGSDGTFKSVVDPVTGNRGVWELGNGNLLTTNGAGVHEVDPTTNTLVRTIVSGVSARFVSLYSPPSSGTPGNPPGNVSATGGSSSVQLTWDAPIDGVELLYDDNTGEGNLSIGATAEGDLAVRFTPNVYPSTLLSIKVWFSATADPAAMTSGNYTVWDGTSAGPGTSLATGSHPINRGGFETVDVSSAGVTINSDDFFISYNEPNGEALFITWDTDGVYSDRSWVNAPLIGFPWQTLGNTGIAGFDNNLMIRAIVQEGSGPNARIVELGSDGSRHTLPMSDLKSLFRQFNAQGGAAGVSQGAYFLDGSQPQLSDAGSIKGDPVNPPVESLDGYNIYRSDDNVSFSQIASVDSLTFSYEDGGLSTGTYYYYLTAVYTEGESDPSDTVSATVSSLDEAFADHSTAAILASVTNEGNIGWLNTFPPAPGSGFQFNPATSSGQRLFEGAIIVATDSFHVSDAARDETQVFDADFQFTSNIDGSGSTGTTTEYVTSYSDALAEVPLGVDITQTTYSVDEPGKDRMVLYQLDVANNSGANLADVKVGAFFDWDVDPATANDRGQVVTDSTNTIPGVNGGNPFGIEVLELHQGSGANAYMGVVPLSQSVFAARRIMISADEVYPPRMTDGDKWSYLSFNRATNPNGDGGSAQDHAQIFGLSPVNIDNGASERVGFAMVAGATLSEMMDAARAAQQMWVDLGNSIFVITGIEDGLTGIPTEFSLQQNYPNPFNPTTTIRYGLREDAKVSVKIYNVLGQVVKTLVNNRQTAGFKTAVWDGTNDFGAKVSSGIYIYRIEANDFVDSKKMILLK
ncbi:MAG: T9SS type A sorting domain-containing protein [Calditrichae bacterium]|nr:T9SS type A sorting domain-containing protein [Calditrichia bacterium]